MKKELKNLLHRLLWSISKNGEAGINNAIVDVDVDDAEYEFDYLIKALTELKHLENGEEVNFRNVRKALDCCISSNGIIKDKVKAILDYGYHCALDDFYGEDKYKVKSKELDSMYHPSDELLDEFINLMCHKTYLDWVCSIPADVILD